MLGIVRSNLVKHYIATTGKRLVISAILSLFMLGSSTILIHQPAHAVSTSGFKAGNIMSNYVMSNKGAMTEAQIQAFLKSKNSCNDRNLSRLTAHNSTYGYLNYGGKKYEYHLKNGHFVCMADQSFGGESAAHIIYRAAQDYNINPQVLIVLLQKEQGLITDTWPNYNHQYAAATGYDCPDTPSGCNSANSGFKTQIRKAAALFHEVLSGGWSNYPVGKNYIQYNPSASCGGSVVNIQNRATSALYRYTPYQPNSAALKAGFGTATCGAYGNRNFYIYFTSWFGSTQGTPFFRLNGGNAVYVLGADSNFYHVVSPAQLKDFGYGKTSKSVDNVGSSFVSGLKMSGDLPPIVRFDSSAIYAVVNGKLHHFTTSDIFHRYGYDFGQEANLDPSIKYYLSSSSNMGAIMRLSDSDVIYYVDNGKKQPFTSWAAYTTLGDPTYSSQNYATLDSDYASTLPTSKPIVAGGDVLKTSDTGKYGVWFNDELQPINTSVAQGLDLKGWSGTSSVISKLPDSSNTLGRLAKSSTNNLYLLDNKKKIKVTSQLPDIEKQASDFVATSDQPLRTVPTQDLGKVVRQDNNDSVYVIKDNKLYNIPSLSDFYGLGYSFDQVTVLNSSNFSLLNESGRQLYAPGKLIRLNGGDAVYIIDSNYTKRHIPSMSLFTAYGFKMSSVSNVSSAQAAEYSTGADMSQIIKSSSNNTVYKVENGKKRPFANQKALLSSGYSFDKVLTVSASIVNGLATGKPIN